MTEGTLVLGMGVGTFVLCALYVLVIIAALAMSRTPSGPVITLACVVIAGVVTLVLLLLPRESADDATSSSDSSGEEVDHYFAVRIVMAVVLSLTFLLGLVLVAVMHLTAPNIATRIDSKKFR